MQWDRSVQKGPEQPPSWGWVSSHWSGVAMETEAKWLPLDRTRAGQINPLRQSWASLTAPSWSPRANYLEGGDQLLPGSPGPTEVEGWATAGGCEDRQMAVWGLGGLGGKSQGARAWPQSHCWGICFSVGLGQAPALVWALSAGGGSITRYDVSTRGNIQ